MVEERANFVDALSACESESIPHGPSTLLRPSKIGEVYAKMEEADIYEGNFRVNLKYNEIFGGWVDGHSMVMVRILRRVFQKIVSS